ncbi:MAG: tRNA (N6-threonylcarbamoyladenosine(37)-N6)-methyltransferase TrmO [Proteobacteria bacterium]|nr:tRNA (N6-threonylcarbamoyladenosine(37)-N6)-methyltransferase TrmO [Pseudomonadota bacterium]
MLERKELVPIGYVRSPLKKLEEAPRQGREAGTVATIELLPAYGAGLEGLVQGIRLLVVCWMHLASRDTLLLRPRRDPSAPLTGVFATRSPNRPNPLAIYTADLLEIDGLRLLVRGIDAVDGTPVVDLRPHRPHLDG